MHSQYKKHSKIVAVLLSLVLIAPLFLYVFDPSTSGIYAREQAGDIEFTQDDLRIAADISNTTGALAEEILDLRRTGKSWNAILEQLGNGSRRDSGEQRMYLLESAGLSEELRKRLETVEFDSADILTARAMIERIKLQLQELAAAGANGQPLLLNGVLSAGAREEALQTIQQQFDDQQALFVALAFRAFAGSLEAAVDEYLFSLQASIDIAAYVENWDRYTEEKQTYMSPIEPLTLLDLEQMAAEAIRQNNSKAQDDQSVTTIPTATEATEAITQGQAGLRLPETADIKPVNPAQRVLEEINQIKPGQVGEEQ